MITRNVVPRNIIVLDIDGVIITSGMLAVNPIAALNRDLSLNKTAVSLLNILCERGKAHIVVNSAHNVADDRAAPIDVALEIAGLDPAYLVSWPPAAPMTQYPHIETKEAALDKWIKSYEQMMDAPVRWCVFEDSRYDMLKIERMGSFIHVDADHGLILPHINDALEYFGEDPINILM